MVVSWYDARNDANDVKTQFFAAASSNGGQIVFSQHAGQRRQRPTPPTRDWMRSAKQNQYGDYTGVAFAGGILYPAWTDNSPDLPGNPDLPQFDIAEGRPAVAHVADLPLTAKPLDISADVKDEGSAVHREPGDLHRPRSQRPGQLLHRHHRLGRSGPQHRRRRYHDGHDPSQGDGQFTVSGTHVYQAASTYTITITIKDKGGSSVSVTTPAVIQDAPLNPGGERGADGIPGPTPPGHRRHL